MNKKGQLSSILLIVVGIVMVVIGAAISQDVIDNAGLNGSTYTVINNLPVFLGLMGLALVAAGVITLFGRR